MKRYNRNIGTITVEEQLLLAEKSVCVIGCGGLGGGVIENLVRMGVGHITAVDGDVFDESNLNRQVLSNEDNMGKSKAIEAATQMRQINSNVRVTPINDLFTEENAEKIVNDHDVIVDALDNVEARIILETACEKADVPLVHGAIGGWNGQLGVVMPGSRIISQLYGCNTLADKSTNPAFTPAVVSAMEAAEVIKVLLGRKEALKNKLLIIDLLDHEYDIIDFE